jgi:hypothetical protein
VVRNVTCTKFYSENLKGRDHLEVSKLRWKGNRVVRVHGLESSGSVKGPVVGCYNEPTGSLKGREFSDRPRD